jgi:hypothetical protein
MDEIKTIGLDLAKHVFQVHGVDASGTVVLRKRLRRSQVVAFFAGLPRCLVGLEACATAHYWARELQAVGHEVRLMPAQYVKAYVKRNKNDAGAMDIASSAATAGPMTAIAKAMTVNLVFIVCLHPLIASRVDVVLRPIQINQRFRAAALIQPTFQTASLCPRPVHRSSSSLRL